VADVAARAQRRRRRHKRMAPVRWFRKGASVLDRAAFQRLANERIADAKAMLAAKRWSAAYYVAGYAVECGLKSCILVRVAASADIIFEDRRFSEKCWTHSLTQLIELAGIKSEYDAAVAADPELADNWEAANEWTELSRYEHKTRDKAQRLYDAVVDKKHGVMSWIKQWW
jgi:HEPN domain-containing protein